MAATMGAQERDDLVLAELFGYMDRRGIKRTWLADQLGISPTRLWNYEHFQRRAPEWFIPKACRALDVLPERFGYTRTKTTSRRAS